MCAATCVSRNSLSEAESLIRLDQKIALIVTSLIRSSRNVNLARTDFNTLVQIANLKIPKQL